MGDYCTGAPYDGLSRRLAHAPPRAGSSARPQVRSVGSTLGAALGAQLSESSVQMFHEIASALGSQEVLTTLFGNALKPNAGIACPHGLKALLAAAEQRGLG